MECWSPECLCLSRLQGTGSFPACQPLELSCSSGWLWMLITAAAQLSLSLSAEKCHPKPSQSQEMISDEKQHTLWESSPFLCTAHWQSDLHSELVEDAQGRTRHCTGFFCCCCRGSKGKATPGDHMWNWSRLNGGISSRKSPVHCSKKIRNKHKARRILTVKLHC